MSLILLLSLGLAAQDPLAVLTVDSASPYSNYGESVAIDGSWAMVGAPDDYLTANYMGSVYVFEKTAQGWIERQKLTASNPQGFDTFGHTIEIHGEVAAIGAPGPLGIGPGSVYVFRYDGQSWQEEAVLSQTTGWGDDWFGYSLDMDADRILVGSMWSRQPGLNFGGPNHAGAAWVFHWNGNQWVFEQELGASDMAGGDLFGSGVALNGDTLMVGAREEGDESGTNPIYGMGAVYVFERVGGTWVEQQKLRASDFSDFAWFGFDVAAQGDWMVVGSPGKTGGGWHGAGVSYLFRKTAGQWNEYLKIESAMDGTTGNFGRSVDMDGNLVVVAADGKDYLGNSYGAVFPFRWNGSGWDEEPAIAPLGLGPWDLFARNLDLDGQDLIAGAYLENLPPPLSPGAGFLYDVSPQFHLMLNPLPLDVQEDAKFILRHGIPQAPAWLAYSLQGLGTTPVPPLGVSLDLANAQALDVMKITDAQGGAHWDLVVPANAVGASVWFQGLQNGQVSNPIYSEIR
ncbi:MAG: hypothetical protein DWQ01_21045 [Planctomycetota bacterium]|nr:MAG: hypothetical protein DWQ01_21045 [Planctomycetota bacterium]